MRFSRLSAKLQGLEETASRNAITELLAEIFKEADTDEIGIICYLLQGRVAPLYEAVEFGMADKFIIRAIAKAYDKDQEEVRRVYKKQGDIGATAEELHTGKTRDLTISEVFEKLKNITESAGQGSQEKKITILSEILAHVSPLSARYIARIPIDRLRLGFSEITMLDALSFVLSGDKSKRGQLEDAYNVRPDIGFIARSVKQSGLEGLTYMRATIGTPVLAQLCQRLPNADDMIKKMGEVAVEPKYDGVRVQIHYKKGKNADEIQTFSRNLENTTAMFPELAEAGKFLAADTVILDAEAIGIDPGSGRFLPFQETATRKRKHNIASVRQSVPLRFFVFDVLYCDGKDVLRDPLSKRREMLRSVIKKDGKLFVISPQIITGSSKELRDYHDVQLDKGLEGVVVKKWNSPYEPGRRGYSWVKFKEEEGKTGKLADTIDGVIMGYYLGKGKRTVFGIGALLVGVRRRDGFVTMTKIGTGVSDELWKKLQKKLQKIRVKHKPVQYAEVDKTLVPDVWVTPAVVVEVAGDDLTNSPTHGAQYAIRFPRLVRIRTDKTPQLTTTTNEVKNMYRMQKGV